MAGKISILLFGQTGSGKSTIANALVRTSKAQTGDGVQGVTIETNYVKGYDYEIIDTVGLGETEIGTMPHDDAVKNIESFIQKLDIELHHICFVAPAGRIDGLTKVFWVAFNKIFEKSLSNVAIIITKCREGWIEENIKDIHEILGNVPIVGVNFHEKSEIPDEEIILEKRRAESLNMLENFLQNIRSKPGFTTTNPHPDRSIAEDITKIFQLLNKRTYETVGWLEKASTLVKHMITRVMLKLDHGYKN